MSKEIGFRVPNPCHENWNKMSPIDQGKFCRACDKTVIDFSLMTNPEILQHISVINGNVCGRFNKDQLNRPVIISNTRKFSFTYGWSILLATTLLGMKSNAQGPFVKGKVKLEQRPQPKAQLMGVVAYIESPQYLEGSIVDSSDNSEVGNATITVLPDQFVISADSNGNFKISMHTIKSNSTITISAIGFKTKIISLNTEKYPIGHTKRIGLEKEPVELPMITVLANPEMITGILGEMVSVQRVTVFEKLKDSISTVFTNTKLRVFPNPVYPGGMIHVKFDLEIMDQYELQISNSAGQIIKSELLKVQMKNQVKQIMIPTGASKGIYFVRVQHQGLKKVYHTKFIVK